MYLSFKHFKTKGRILGLETGPDLKLKDRDQRPKMLIRTSLVLNLHV